MSTKASAATRSADSTDGESEGRSRWSLLRANLSCVAQDDAARWDAKYSGRPSPHAGASAALSAWQDMLPTRGKALDLAGGDGAQAVWLAQRGLDVTLVDVSPVACARAEVLANANAVPLQTVAADLERMLLPEGPWSLVLCTNYLQRCVWKQVAKVLAVDGVAVWIHPTVRNLERHSRPSLRFLLADGEGPRILQSAGLDVQQHREDWVGDPPRFLCQVVARRRPGSVRMSGRD